MHYTLTTSVTTPTTCRPGKNPIDCNISGPCGMNGKGVIWRCGWHQRLFVADYHSGEPRG